MAEGGPFFRSPPLIRGINDGADRNGEFPIVGTKQLRQPKDRGQVP